VAIKILPAHLSDNPEAKQRFDREARAISSLNHPNVCTLYDCRASERDFGCSYRFADVFASLHDDLADQLRFIDAVLDLPRDLARRIRPEFEIVGFAGRDMQ